MGCNLVRFSTSLLPPLRLVRSGFFLSSAERRGRLNFPNPPASEALKASGCVAMASRGCTVVQSSFFSLARCLVQKKTKLMTGFLGVSLWMTVNIEQVGRRSLTDYLVLFLVRPTYFRYLHLNGSFYVRTSFGGWVRMQALVFLNGERRIGLLRERMRQERERERERERMGERQARVPLR